MHGDWRVQPREAPQLLSSARTTVAEEEALGGHEPQLLRDFIAQHMVGKLAEDDHFRCWCIPCMDPSVLC
eukprot:scaffold2879_cov269-Prasinococcus_capsulatus_cf.AAC.28